MFKRSIDQIGLFWDRYVNAIIEATDSPAQFTLSGEEFGLALLRKHHDPRAAAICLSPSLKVVADGTKIAQPQVGQAAPYISSILIIGIKHEISCLNSFGRIPDYPDSILAFEQEDWSQYNFVKDEYLDAIPGFIRGLRVNELAIPDYSNVVELQPGAIMPLERAI